MGVSGICGVLRSNLARVSFTSLSRQRIPFGNVSTRVIFSEFQPITGATARAHCTGQRNVTRVDLSETLYIRVSGQQSLAAISPIKAILSVARLYRLLGDFVAGEVFGLSSSAEALVPAVYIGSRPTLRGPFPLQSACV